MRSLPAAGLVRSVARGSRSPSSQRWSQVSIEPSRSTRRTPAGTPDRRELGADRRRHEQAGEDRQASRAMPHSPSREKSSGVHTLSAARLASSQFTAAFATRPAVGASAPGRVNLLGEHTDYNGGPVLPIALERRLAVMAGPAPDWQAVSSLDGSVHQLDVAGPLRGAWTDYLVGVVRELHAVGAAPRGARVSVAGTVPVGAGLSSSAALTVAATRALSLLAGRPLEPADLVEVAFRAEHDQVGVRCGRMDQTIAVHARRGTALLYETGLGTFDQLPFPGRVWVVDTGVSHALAGGQLNQRRRECEAALERCRAWRPGLRAPGGAGACRSGRGRATAAAVPDAARAPRGHRDGADPRGRCRARRRRPRSRGPAPPRGACLAPRRLRLDGPGGRRPGEHAVALGAYGARLTGAGWGGAVVMLLPPDGRRRSSRS